VSGNGCSPTTRKVIKMQGKGNTETKKDRVIFNFFGLTNEDAHIRNQWKIGIFIVILFMLCAMTTVPANFEVKEGENHFVLIFASVIKYIPLLAISHFLAKKRAAAYLKDIFELKDEDIALQFIEKVAFGGAQERVIINQGKISKEAEETSLILIGGPGEILVHMGDAVIVETIRGEPKIITAEDKITEIGSFERIREIGQHEYAIINLRDQFLGKLQINARTKDGIRVQIKDIKIFFSVLRETESPKTRPSNKKPFSFDENAALSLVYKQIVMEEKYDYPTSVKFPWNTTAVPLVINELEEIIQSKPLSEILASISQREIDEITEQKTKLDKAWNELNVETNKEKKTPTTPPNFMPRSMFTEHFKSPSFKEKAAALGISIRWVDIGTWEIESEIITEKLKEAYEQRKKNEKKEKEINLHETKLTLEKTGKLIQKVIIENFEKNVALSELPEGEFEKLAKKIKINPELANPQIFHHLIQKTVLSETANHKSLSMLNHFRVELLDAKETISKELDNPIERDAKLRSIDNAIKAIEKHIYRYI
jgi:hypothetical protein